MDGIVTLTCNSCGGKLKITPDLEKIACLYFGDLIVRKKRRVPSMSKPG